MKLINLPNIITCCNLICGCLAVYYGFSCNIFMASVMILSGAVFDFFDGMTARAMHISGPIGKELDSLADMITFGVAPSTLCFYVLQSVTTITWLPFLAFIMAAFSGLRLAKFNCDERQSLSFIGLATPANAILWIGISNICSMGTASLFSTLLNEAICSYLLISEIPMFSLKIKPGHNGFAENWPRYIFLALTVLFIVLTLIIDAEKILCASAPIIILYIVMSVIDTFAKRK